MADQPNAAASTPSAPQGNEGQAQPAGGFQLPAGQRLVAEAEWQRTQDRLRGQHEYVEAGRKHGFTDPKAFEPYGKFSQTLGKHKGLTLEQLTMALEAQAQAAEPQQGPGGGAFDPAALDKWAESKGFVSKEAMTKQSTLDRATITHESAAEREQHAFKALSEEFLGKDASEWDRKVLPAALRAMIDEKRGVYPDGHPLAGTHLAPMDEAGIKSVFAEMTKLRDSQKGAQLAAIGAGKRGVTSPAGSSAQSPTTLPKAASSNDTRPGGLPSVASLEAAHAKKVARRGGAPTSSMGGS